MPLSRPSPAVLALTALALAVLATRLLPAASGATPGPDSREALGNQPHAEVTPSATTWQDLAERVTAACGGSNPYLVTTRFSGKLASSQAAREPAVFAFRDTAADDLAQQIVLATQAQVGAVYGLAYDAGRNQLYAAAYHKRGAPFGPGGPGAIYQIDLSAGAVATWVQLSAGPDRHDRPLGDDRTGALWVGRTGLGDIDLDDDGNVLFVANLHDRHIYRLSVPDAAILGRFPFGALGTSWERDARLFGLAYRDGLLYHGVMDVGTSTQPQGTAATGHIYQSLPDGSELREVAVFGIPIRTVVGQKVEGWWGSGAIPMLTDIEFRPGGDVIIGVRNRSIDATTGQCQIYPSGELLLGVQRAEGWDVATEPGHYNYGPGTGLSPLTGALAGIRYLDQVVSPEQLTFPEGLNGGQNVCGWHALWFDNAGGQQVRREALVWLDYPPDLLLPLGTGDLEVLCDRSRPLDPDLIATETRRAGDAGTATREAVATSILATQTAILATHTQAVATAEARGTAAALTATALAGTGTPAGATPPSRGPAATLTAVWSQLTVQAPTRWAQATAATTADLVPEVTRVAAALAYDRIKASCSSDNPYLAISSFVPFFFPQVTLPRRTATPTSPPAPVVQAFNDSYPESVAGHLRLAYEHQAGAVFGLAYDWRRGQLYASAYNKALAAFGPAGPGAIYRIDLATGAVRPWAWLDAGRDRHHFSDGLDAAAGAFVGKLGIGDIELDEAGGTLFAVNLHDRLIYRLTVPDGKIVDIFPHGGAEEPWAAHARPFGLGVHNGWLYHGLVDDRARSSGARSGLMAYVYRSRFDGSQMTEVARLDLDYSRPLAWRAWSDTPAVSGAMLTDIEFRPNGDLILGLRERAGDGPFNLGGVGNGGILPTIRTGDRWLVWTDPEFYVNDESAWGSLASLPGLDIVVASMLDPWGPSSGGAVWYDNLSGHIVRRETVYDYQANYPTFLKAAGLGDVEVLCPPWTPTSSPTPTATASLTPSQTPSSTATCTATRVPSATPTQRPRPVYLPLALRESCAKRQLHADVVLVIDVSTSMRRLAGDGQPKLAAVQAAARAFVDRMDLAASSDAAGDSVAVVAFNDRVWLEQALTGNRRLLFAAIDGLGARLAEGTRLDLALEGGMAALRDPGRRPENTAVIVLLTDGLPNRVPTPTPWGSQEDTVLAAARRARDAGIRIYAIGVGRADAPDLADRINPELLRQVASSPRMYYETWSAEELAAIYREIAYTIGCPPDSFWGRRG